MSAVRGTFADFKTVKTRGVCQLIIEVPIEAADHALSVLGGVPQAKAEQWVGIAPVTAPAEPADEQTTPKTVEDDAPERPKGGERTRRAWDDIPMPQQAGILVSNVESARWIALYLGVERKLGMPGFNPQTATDEDWRSEADIALKRACLIESKSELGIDAAGKALNPNARIQFDSINREYRASQHGQSDPEIARQREAGPT